MFRALVAVVYAITILGPSAWGQLPRIVRIPAAVSPPVSAPMAPVTFAGVPGAAAVEHTSEYFADPSALTHLSAAVALPNDIRRDPTETQAVQANFADGLRPKGGSALSLPAGEWRRGLSNVLAKVVFRRGSCAAVRADEPPSPGAFGPKKKPRLTGFWAGTFGAQISASALQVLVPLSFLHLTSPGVMAWAVTAGAAFDAFGALFGGKIIDRIQAAGIGRVLLATTLARGGAIAAFAALLPSGAIPPLVAVYLLESFARGIADTARNVYPTEVAGDDAGILKQVYARYQFFFETGGFAGPFLAGALMMHEGLAAALSQVSMVFAAVAFAYWSMPKREGIAGAVAAATSPVDVPAGFAAWMRWALLATALLTLYPLKGVLPAIFATQVLHDQPSAAWLVGLFGLGGVLGSFFYGSRHYSLSTRSGLIVGGLGTLGLAAAFLHASFFPAAIGVFVFAASNVVAQLALKTEIQARAVAAGRVGAAMGSVRFTANLTGMLVRFLAGGAFALALAPQASFALVGIATSAAALVSLHVAGRLTGLKTPRLLWLLAGGTAIAALCAAPSAFAATSLGGVAPAASTSFPGLSSLALAGVISSSGTNIFDRDPASDSDKARRNSMRKKRGPHFYFRGALFAMQWRFAQLFDHAPVPRVLLHGNPHVDQYSKSAQGAAMVDFDRSRYGPYAWDLLRLLVSVSLRQKKPVDGLLLAPDVLERLRDGYWSGFTNPERAFSPMRLLKDVGPAPDEATTNAYLRANKKWANEMREHPLPPHHPEVVALLASYLAGRGETDLLNDYWVEEAGRGFGTMGNDRIFIVLAPKATQSGVDRLLLEMKRTYRDPDSRWYSAPRGSNGRRLNDARRMILASDLYAPDWDLMPGEAALNGVQYYGHRLPTQNLKLKKMLDQEQQRDLLYAVGTQLGRAHRLSLRGAAPEELQEHFARYFDEIAAAALTIRDELLDAHARYLARMRREGLEPKGEDEEE